MEITTEIRWFFQGKIQNVVISWFAETQRFGDPLTGMDGDEREDLYLLMGNNVHVSPKLREGKLEIKVRGQTEEFADPQGQNSGVIERWKKWEWKYADTKKKDDAFEKTLDKLIVASFLKNTPDDSRLNVWKRRFQRKFTLDSNGTIMPTGQASIDEGFRAEVTELKVNDEAWWTIAFEVVENPNKPMKDPIMKLRQGINWIFKAREYKGPLLEPENSYSYPAWLNDKIQHD
jgi:hypothetical protein